MISDCKTQEKKDVSSSFQSLLCAFTPSATKVQVCDSE